MRHGFILSPPPSAALSATSSSSSMHVQQLVTFSRRPGGEGEGAVRLERAEGTSPMVPDPGLIDRLMHRQKNRFPE